MWRHAFQYQPPSKLLPALVIKLASPVLPCTYRPQAVPVAADLAEEARLHIEDVEGGVPVVPSAAAARRVPLASADAVAPKVLGRVGKAYAVTALAVEATHGGADLPLDVAADVIRDGVAEEL